MALSDSFEELETLDIPRGVVKAANLHAASRVPIAEVVKYAAQARDPENLMQTAREAYAEHFNSFVAGAHWALGALAKDHKPFERVVSLTTCDDFAHVFQGEGKTCQCGGRRRDD